MLLRIIFTAFFLFVARPVIAMLEDDCCRHKNDMILSFSFIDDDIKHQLQLVFKSLETLQTNVDIIRAEQNEFKEKYFEDFKNLLNKHSESLTRQENIIKQLSAESSENSRILKKIDWDPSELFKSIKILQTSVDGVQAEQKQLKEEIFKEFTYQLNVHSEKAKRQEGAIMQVSAKNDDLSQLTRNVEANFKSIIAKNNECFESYSNMQANQNRKYKNLNNWLKNVWSNFSEYKIELSKRLTTLQDLQAASIIVPPRNCTEALRGNNKNGFYKISNSNFDIEPFWVYCYQDKSIGKEPAIIFRRRNPKFNTFNRTWTEYEQGFGIFEENFFLGLKQLHILTAKGEYEIHTRLYNDSKQIAWGSYDDFIVGDGNEAYEVKALAKHKGRMGIAKIMGKKFSTFDNNNSVHKDVNCAARTGLGWWFGDCNQFSFKDLTLWFLLFPKANGLQNISERVRLRRKEQIL